MLPVHMHVCILMYILEINKQLGIFHCTTYMHTTIVRLYTWYSLSSVLTAWSIFILLLTIIYMSIRCVPCISPLSTEVAEETVLVAIDWSTVA